MSPIHKKYMFKLNNYHLETTLYSSGYYSRLVRICILTLSRFHFCSVSIYNDNRPEMSEFEVEKC